jgi:putative effector of murein hydrolase LrgA (UPF0299 family)
MIGLRRAELICGLTTGIIGIALPFLLSGSNVDQIKSSPALLVDALGLFIVPAVIVGFASYLHAVSQKSWARKILWLMAVVYLPIGCINLLVGAYGGGWQTGVLATAPSLLAIATLILSLKVP